MFLKWLTSVPDNLSQCSLKKRFLLSFVAGALCVPAMPPYGWWIMLGLGLPVLFLLLASTRSAKTAFFDGWFFAFGYFGFGLSWIANALLIDGNPFVWAWPLAIAGLPALLAIFYGLFGAALKLLVPVRAWSGWCAFVGGLAFTEWVRGHIFTGFPWNIYGYTWNDALAMAQSVSLFGSYGLTALTILFASLPALWWLNIGGRKDRGMVTGVVCMGMIGLFLWGHARLAAHPLDLRGDVILRIVQPNIPQADKWNYQMAGENFRKLLAQSQPEEANATATTIVIWPETAVIERALMHPETARIIRDLLQAYPRDAYLSTGILRSDLSPLGQNRYYNSLVTYDSNLSVMTSYDKSHLVPFGEYIPYRDYIPLKPVVAFEGFEAGSGPETQAIDRRLNISPLVCYEVIFPGKTVSRTGAPSDLMINVTNDAWYGDSAGPRQHLAMGRFRAIEEAVPLARSANTGISGMFDAYGRLIAQAPLDEAKALNVALPRTGVAAYPRVGDLPFFIFVISLLGLAIYKQRR